MTGVMMSTTSELTIAPKAAPMITPMARLTTLPRNANFLNSSSMARPCLDRERGLAEDVTRRGGLRFANPPYRTHSIDQPRMHHCLAHEALRAFGRWHHRQAHRVRALAE